MVYLDLARHRDTWSYEGVHETFAFSRLQSVHQPLSYSQKKYLGGKETPFTDVLRDIAADEDAHGPAPSLAQSFFFSASRNHPKGKRLLEKTPSHINKVDRVFRDFPKSRVVICTRDPLDMVVSYRKRLKIERELKITPESKLKWLDVSLEEIFNKFRTSARKMEHAVATWPDRVILVAYENLTENPDINIARLYEFLDLDPAGRNHVSLPEKKKRADKLHASPITENKSVVSEYLTPEEIDYVRRETTQAHAIWEASRNL